MKITVPAILMLLAVTLGSFAGEPALPAPVVDSKPITLTKNDFIKRVMDYEKNKTEWVYKGDKPAIIDFYADWCGPCKKVAPVMEELAGEYAGKVYIYKINIDKEPELAGLFGVRNIPTFLIIPMKGKPQMSSGASSNHDENKTRFKSIIDDVLLKPGK
jgi:thioredoxin